MSDQNASLNSLLQWSINHSANTASDAPEANPSRGLNPQALAELLGGPSDADLMRSSMAAITAPDTAAEDRAIAWDNSEQLLEPLDNANNLAALGLWTPLLAQLGPEGDAEGRRSAAACVATAVQNNARTQEALLSLGGVPTLARMALEDASPPARKKAISALSAAVRNFQPALDELVGGLPPDVAGSEKKVDAGDMDAVDVLINRLRERIPPTA